MSGNSPIKSDPFRSARRLIAGFMFLTVIVFSFAPETFSAEVTLAWDANTETNLMGYMIYYKTGSPRSPYEGGGLDQGDSGIKLFLTDFQDPKSPQYRLTGLQDNETYYFVVTAFDASGIESGFSNELIYNTPETNTPVENDDSIRIAKGSWTLIFANSEELVREDGAATNAFDGNPNTIWHTQWYGAQPSPPHEIQINLGGLYDIDGFEYIPRQDGLPNGRIRNYMFYMSKDGIEWHLVAQGSYANIPEAQRQSFPRTAGRYVRLVALSEANDQPWTSIAELNILSINYKESIWISPENWSLVHVDSEEKAAEDGAAANAFDGDPSTIWHTQWYRANPTPPHEIRIDLGAMYDISGFECLPRQDGLSNGRIREYAFYVSTHGVEWRLVAEGSYANTADVKQHIFPRSTGKFVRLVALSEVNDSPWTSVAEINILGVKHE